MKKSYIIIIFIAIVGVISSFFLTPGQEEVALMNFKDKKFEESLVAYEEELKKGNLHVSIVGPLIELYLQNGRVDDAIALTERYVEKNPNDIKAREQLGKYYQYAQRQEDYLRNLETLNKMKPDAESMKKLSEIYNFNTQYDKQIETLDQMIVTGEGVTPKVFMDQAQLLASQQKPLDAVKTLEEFQKAFPDKFPFEAIELMVSLLMDNKQPEQALAKSESWVKATPAAELWQIARLANLIHYKGSPDLALSFLEPHKEAGMKSNDYITELVGLYVDNNREKDGYDLSYSLYEQGILPPGLYSTFIDLAIKRNNFELIYELAGKLDPVQFTEDQAINLVELSQSHRDEKLLDAINKKFATAEYLEKNRVFATVLALANQNKNALAMVAELEKSQVMNNRQSLQVAAACARAGEKACSLSFINRLKSQDGLSDREVEAIARLYIYNRMYDEGYAYITTQRKSRITSTQGLDRAWVVLAASRGSEPEFDAWLTAQPKIADTQTLTDIFFLSKDRGHVAIAQKAAERLRQQDDNPQTRNYLGQALLANKRYADATALLREGKDASANNAMLYLAALSRAAAKSPEFKAELNDFVTARLKDGKTSEKEVQQMLYAMVESGASDVVMPYIKSFAYNAGGSWASIYEEHLTRKGRTGELYDFRMARLKQGKLSTKEQKSIAFALLDMGYKDDALPVFERLATKAKPNSDDVRLLIYLWGPRPTSEQVNWLQARADNAPEAEKGAWLKYIADYGDPARVIDFVEEAKADVRQPGVGRSYLQAIASTNDYEKLASAVQSLTAVETDPEHVRAYARFAHEHYLLQAARKAYMRLEELKPADEEAILNIGRMSYGLADYSMAKDYIEKYIALEPKKGAVAADEYQVYFYYAELMTRERKLKEADQYYLMAAQSMETSPNKMNNELKSMAAKARIRMGERDPGLGDYRNLVLENQQDMVLVADLMESLIESKRYEEARKVKIWADAQRKLDNSSEVFRIPAQMINGSQSFEDGKEVYLLLGRPTDALPVVSAFAATPSRAVNYVNTGYDTLLIGANPGQQLWMNNEAGDVVVYTRRDQNPAIRLNQQAELRLELLTARMELETGDHARAVKRLNIMLAKHPNDSQLLGFTANAENFVGRWRRADQLLDQAAALAPENEDIALLQRDIERDHSQHIKLDMMWRSIEQHNEYIAEVSGFAFVRSFLELGAKYAVNEVRAKQVRRADGRFGNFKETATQGEIYAAYSYDSGVRVKASVFTNEEDVGVGGYFEFIHDYGRTGLEAEWQRPYWGFVEGTLDDATRDRLAVTHNYIINPDWVVDGALGFNRYNVDGDRDVASSVQLTWSVVHRLLERHPYLSVGYIFDGEYSLDRARRIDALGISYRPFPFVTREVHSINLTSRYDFNENTYADAILSYGIDRYAGHGPSAEVRLTHEFGPREQFQAQVRASHGAGFGAIDGDVDIVGGHLMWKF